MRLFSNLKVCHLFGGWPCKLEDVREFAMRAMLALQLGQTCQMEWWMLTDLLNRLFILDHHPQDTGEIVRLDQMSMQQTMPVFGTDSILNKSPYVGMPEDFMAYLFNTHGEGSPTVVPVQGLK